ncbi:alkane hydroxylase MAH1-like [Durio zibethinus]|uniref:Alkane hydroxylase MAH1-like n=1 Tax=Durio zibethinus TaxID=66656 RepID=A0A6P6BBA7_DURZI|nr:alkane hydroxylase MAH1-like [Durio zibethinus]
MAVDMLIAILFIFFFLCLGHRLKNRNSLVTNWPIVGMLPALVSNSDRIFDFLTDMATSHGGTFKFKGPWFPSLDFVVTSHPLNVNHILCRNHGNYEKGPEFREIFEPFGEGIVTSDSHVWKSQRKVLQSLTKNNKKYAMYLDRIFWKKLEKSLIPVLEHVMKLGVEVDLENLLQRFDYDHICLLALGIDPNTLSVEFPNVPSKVAFDEVEEVLLYRNLVPKMVWKIQRWLQIGEEKKLSKGLKIVDDFVYGCISSRREKLRSETTMEDDDQFDLLTAFMVEEEGSEMSAFGKSDKFLRDTAYSFVTAGKDTINIGLTWFFWLIATHPSVGNKILEEIKANSPTSNDGNLVSFSVEELNKFVYLHATLCETLRLYPPVPVNNKSSIESDVLPSGDRVGRNTRILLSVYSMGRSEEIWGEDYLEFKPERWISELGNIVQKPSYVFVPFGAGPRVCLGKDMSFKQMKTVVINVLRNYQVELVENQTVALSSKAIALHTEHGLKVRIKKRCV